MMPGRKNTGKARGQANKTVNKGRLAAKRKILSNPFTILDDLSSQSK